MTIFVQMPININTPVYSLAKFKARYLELTGESVQDNPPQNAQGTHYIIGSSRLTQVHADQLANEFPQVIISNAFPVGWEPKEDPDGPPV